ncbi:class I SAM-dependent RNA methyltransferase [Frigidibacter albus]|uniref:Class I SAM-dependent RNA methyltransferase n=1 Tax=Frigidibacter albus TaxID=1465486 RepID=A0A6L8VKC9_9RHOB|nr:class I SAM-dependent RNA methyltransferase [Frigidibacter albus]MZQ89829.1 class I SAM-dependent RNA methyltransferase [Frigidibacter albus]NBE31796.1 class I SAM-dependent RNA methyltransferase [Frigidibacter albus]GGH56449.1 RNA methyltransferase [Frigidibacter albus]
MTEDTPTPADFEIFLVAPPGLEALLCDEVREAGFADPQAVPGGVTIMGGWPEVWRANLQIRGASRVLARIGAFRAMHLAQLDKRARKFPWADILRPDVPLKVEVTCKASRIYHAGAAAQRIETALREELGVAISPEAEFKLKVRIDDDLCTISVDTSGESLHKRGHKEAVNKAPMRETLAALFLRQCGYDGTEPVVDPMCGSGTFVIEAAEIAAGLLPGRTRHFAFEQLASFDPAAWDRMRNPAARPHPALRFYGADRDAGAIKMSRANAERAGVTDLVQFATHAISDLMPPEGKPGLVIVNPPYGTRIGNKNLLYGLYAALGQTLLTRFGGWRVGLVTSEPSLAKATGLPFAPPSAPVPHGGLGVQLFQTKALR